MEAQRLSCFRQGELPRAAAGGSIGLLIGSLILATRSVINHRLFAAGLQPCAETLLDGFVTARYAKDDLRPPRLDPSGGSAAAIQERTERAARQLARGQEQLVLLLLTAIVTYLTRGQMKAGVMNSMESIATRSARLQAEISNKEFASWLAKNERNILAEPELRTDDMPKFKKSDPELGAMMEHYGKQDKNFVPLEKQLSDTTTFEPVGVSKKEIDAYLATEEGREYLNQAALADPKKSLDLIYDRVSGQLASGSALPTAKIINAPLVKIVAEGGAEPKFSPYFTTYDEFKKAASSDKTLADAFGLPLISEGSRYTIYEITPLAPAKIYISEIAPTIELGGIVERTGGAIQYVVPNRGLWTPAKPIGFIGN